MDTIKELKKPVLQSESSETNMGFGVGGSVGGREAQPQGSGPSGPTASRDLDKRLAEVVVDNGSTTSSSRGSDTTAQSERNTNGSEGAEVPAVPDAPSQPQPTGREGDSHDVVLQAEVRVGEHPAAGGASAIAVVAAAPSALTPPTTMSSAENHAAEGRRRVAAAAKASAMMPAAEQRAARDLEESCGSLEGDVSTHSRWSLPDSRGIGGIGAVGGLHEQRGVWAGGQDDDSVGTVEQAPSSVEGEEGGREEDGKSPSRSRVESYDLQQEPVRTGCSEALRKMVHGVRITCGSRKQIWFTSRSDCIQSPDSQIALEADVVFVT